MNPSIICYKCTRSDGTDFRTGTINYAAALEQGVAVEILDAEPPTGIVCFKCKDLESRDVVLRRLVDEGQFDGR